MSDIFDIYDSPEIIKNQIFNQESDVFAFGMIVYKIIMEEKPYILNGINPKTYKYSLPKFKELIPECYKKLITDCLSLDPKKRPTFCEIVNNLKTNREFSGEKINKAEYQIFINFVEESQSLLKNKNEILTFENYINTRNQVFNKIVIDIKKLRDYSKISFDVNLKSIDLCNFKKIKNIGSGSFGNVYKVIETNTEIIYAAKVSKYEIDQCQEDVLINLSREIKIFACLDHPAIIKFIGYSPINFKNIAKPVIISEFAPNESLDKMMEYEKNGMANSDWNDTKKLINIYGIAAGMNYLHQHDIIHRDLKPANILLDEFLYPKIADFGLSKNILDEDIFRDSHKKIRKKKNSGFKGTYAYCPPEVVRSLDYSKESDVYAFGIIVYELITNKFIFEDINKFQLITKLLNEDEFLPELEQYIPYCYKKLIKDCWDDSFFRPSFQKILENLENDPNFIFKNADKDEYFEYIEFIKKSQKNISNEEVSFKQTINKSINSKRFNETKDELRDFFLNLNDFERREVLNKGGEFKICKIYEKKTKNIYVAQISMIKTRKLSKEDIEKLSKNIKVLLHINHPSILKFIGYSPVNFKKKYKPTIVMELASNGTLAEILEIERNGKLIPNWDNTKKLIIIFGVAAGMSFLHSYNIVHRCLNPSNIYLNDNLFPKIGDFGLSTMFFNQDIMRHQSISGNKNTPIYSAPEVLQNNEYSKMSDVYAFAMTVYEIMSNKKPFDDIENSNKISNDVINKNARLNLDLNIPYCYKRLINECWNPIASERPTFEDIIYHLKMDTDFITEGIDENEFQSYINLIESQKICKIKVEENISNQIKINENCIDELIQSGNVKELINFLNNKCDNETTSNVLYFEE